MQAREMPQMSFVMNVPGAQLVRHCLWSAELKVDFLHLEHSAPAARATCPAAQ